MTQVKTSGFASRFAIVAAIFAMFFAIGASRAEANSITIGVNPCDVPPKVSVYGNEYYWGPFCSYPSAYHTIMRLYVYDRYWRHVRTMVCLLTPIDRNCWWG